MAHKWFFKANDEVISHCGCDDAPAMSAGQLDCPWCGCGWLITCSKCRKAFTYAQVRETDIPLMELGWAEAEARGWRVTEQEVAEWAESMTEMLDEHEVGDIIVYLDGDYFKVDAMNIDMAGYFAAHRFERLPHFDALSDPERLRRVLGTREYWTQRQLADSE